MNNSEILFLYDAKNTNPNGDMDNENKPRRDLDTKINLVSDVRLKRYIRDYLHEAKGQKLFVTSEADTSKDRVKQIIEKAKLEKDEDVQKMIDELIDIRLFGAVFAAKGKNTHLTGPIQFNWGYSLNKVELQASNTITSSFKSGKGIGKDDRVIYSFLAFSGGINGKIAEKTSLSENDIKLFDESMIRAIPFCRTRSKIGQTPRLYLRVTLKNHSIVLKDLREYIKFTPKANENLIRNINDFDINIQELIDYLKTNNDYINKVYYWIDDKLSIIPEIPKTEWELLKL